MMSRRRRSAAGSARASAGAETAPVAAATSARPAGTLYVVATPIGNLGDLGERAATVLGSVALVACEDTRRTGVLLAHLGVRARLVSLHEHNEHRRVPEITALLTAGSSVALVSDAGTPLLADPGFPLVRAAIAAGCPVVAIPGASSVLAALVCSGLPPYPFTFCGFPPRRGGRRRSFFARFAALDHTLVLLESPHRLLETLEDAEAVLGDRPVALCRELTKLHEETLRGTLSAVRTAIAQRELIRGEVVLVIAGRAPGNGTPDDADREREDHCVDDRECDRDGDRGAEPDDSAG